MNMARDWKGVCAIGLASMGLGAFQAGADVTLNVDSAPNVYGSPNWAPWWAAAKTDVTNGSFTNMRNGMHPGTNYFDPLDEIVYSTGDLGKRMHFIYAIDGETTASLDGNFQVKMSFDWDGVDYTYDWNAGGALVEDAPETGWVQPGSWENHSEGSFDGVIGSFGHAWWATDNEAPIYDTGGSIYDEVDEADIAALRESVFLSQTFLLGQYRIKDGLGNWNYGDINMLVIPLPTTVGLGILGLGAVALRRNRMA